MNRKRNVLQIVAIVAAIEALIILIGWMVAR